MIFKETPLQQPCSINAFNLIEKTKQDIKDLEYTSGRINAKMLDLTIGKNIQIIKDLLMKVEQLIYTSS